MECGSIREKKLECNGNKVFEEYVRSNMEGQNKKLIKKNRCLREVGDWMGKTLHVRMVLVCGD